MPKALMMSATIYGTFLKDHEAALKLYNQARRRYPGSVYEADAIFQTAMIEYERARYREASRLFGLYIEKFPTGSKRDVASFMRDASNSPPAERRNKVAEPKTRQKRSELIRVLVLENTVDVRVSGSSSLEIRSPAGSNLLKTIRAPQEARVRFEGGILYVNGDCLSSHRADGYPAERGPAPGQWQVVSR